MSWCVSTTKLLDPDELARLLYFAGIRYFRQGENKLAEDHWLRSLEISRETGDLATQAKLYQNLGWQAKLTGRYLQALEYLEKGKALADECKDISSLSFIYETLGETYYALGDWNKAIENLQESLNLAEQAGLRKATSRVFSVLGDIYRNQGRWAEADECYQRSLAYITPTGSPQSLFVVNLGLGLINMERERYDQAKEFFEKCWEITSKGAGFTSRMAAVKSHMGELYVRLGDLDEAEMHCAEAVRLASEADARAEYAYARMVQGMIAARRRWWDEAVLRYTEAQSIFDELGDKYNQGLVAFEMGMMFLEQGETAQAKTFLERARQIFTELGAKSKLDKFPPGY